MVLLLKLAGVIGALYLIAALMVAFLQDRLLFPRWAVGPDPALPATAERLKLPVEPAAELVGVYLPAEPRPAADASLLLAFGGNAWNAADLASHLRAIFTDRDIVAFHYRGYAPSTGSPSARAILSDALAIHGHVRAHLATDNITVIGVSLGAGPAVHLARHRSVAGLILVTPFDSLHAMAREHYRWLPTRLLMRHRIDVASDLAMSSAPVAVIAAERDTIVPSGRTEAVREAARNLVFDRIIPGAGHNDIYDQTDYVSAMCEALSRIEALSDDSDAGGRK